MYIQKSKYSKEEIDLKYPHEDEQWWTVRYVSDTIMVKFKIVIQLVGFWKRKILSMIQKVQLPRISVVLWIFKNTCYLT